jgi:hypothetical protein
VVSFGHMKQVLRLQNIMGYLRKRWASAPDIRKLSNNTQYTVADGVLAAFAVFFMQSSSFLAHQRFLQSKKGRSNARSLFQIEEIPSDPQIRNLVDPLSAKYFQDDFWFFLDELKRQHRLLQFWNELSTYAIAMDGVSFFSSENISCPKCLKREDRNGTEHFYHSAITPVFVKPGQSQVLPLPPEFIVPQDGSEKQDCERVAAKRWLSQHYQHFPEYSVTYLGDDLYANQPLCQLIAEIYHQFFIFVCKPESHPGLYETLAFLEKNNTLEKLTQRHWNGKHGEIWQYQFANQVPLRNGNEALLVNWLELVITHEKTGAILYRNSFVTNHITMAANIIQLAQVGRTRWKIENENNNTLKTKGYHLEHNFGHGQEDLANVLATLNLLAFLIHTIQEMIEPAYQRLRRALGARKTFFNDLRALTRYMVFDTWDDLFLFMEEGLEIAPEPP